jgi:two-component system OmpR family sensor kinase
VRAISLRTRLVAVAVALVAFAVAALGAGTYAALHKFLYGRLDEELMSTPRLVDICVDPRHPGGPPLPSGAAVALLDVTGAIVSPQCQYGRAVNQLDVVASDVPRLIQNLGKAVTAHSSSGAEFRAVTFAVTTPGGGDDSVASAGGYFVVGKSTSDVSDTLGKLLALELIGGVVAIAGTAALGAAGVRLGLRPLDRVTRTARTVAAELGPDGTGLDRRVPESDPNTEVGRLAEAVNTMLDAVEREYAARWESEQRMRRFLADASHELRTPLTSLRGYAELIRLRGGDGFGEEARDSLRRIESEGTRMSRLVDDLLTLARSDRGVPVERAPVDLAEVVRDAAADLRAAHPERLVSLDAGGPLVVLGDRDQLVQVVSNVLANSAAHATAGGPIAVSAARRDGEVAVSVADTGPGMRPDQVEHAFDRFWRADAARTRTRGGSGLGLSIVRALVADHGGRVTLDSSVEAGTRVTLHLPAAVASGEAGGPLRPG